MIPLGTSAVTFGLGYVIFFNKPPFLWGSSQWLIPMATHWWPYRLSFEGYLRHLLPSPLPTGKARLFLALHQ